MPDFRLPPLNAGERLYRALLCVFPPRFRRSFGQDLVETFRDARRAARAGGVPATAFWMTALEDLFTQAAAEWSATTWRVLRGSTAVDHEESPMRAVPYALRLTELRHAIRRLRRAPSFTVATVVVLALGVGATTAVFGVVNAVLLRPLPYPHAERLVSLAHHAQVSGVGEIAQSDGLLMEYQGHAREFAGIAGYQDRDANLGAISAGERPSRVTMARTTANLFDVLDVRPVLGRGFRTGEDRVGGPAVAIISYATWRDRFHGNPSAVGQRITLDGVSTEIVGVMPRDFAFPHASTAIWTPVRFDPTHAQTGSFNYTGIGRLRPGVTAGAARAELNNLLLRAFDDYPSGIPKEMVQQAHIRAEVKPLRDALVGDVSRLLWILLASVSLVLVIACANVASLFLVRGEARQLESAIRGALGSGLAGMLAQSLSESAVLAAVGGTLGAALATVGVRFAAAAGGALGLPRLDEVSVDGRVLLFALAASAFCAAFVSVIPILRTRRVPIASVLRGGGRGATTDGSRQRARSAFVIAQTALALVLVASSALLARSFARLRGVEPGFNASGVTVVRVFLPRSTYPTAESRARFFNSLLAQVRARPGMRDVSLGDWVPLSTDHNDTVMEVEDHPLPPNGVPDDHFVSQVDPRFFRTMGIPLLTGRSFTAMNGERPTLEVVVSRAFAERYWKGESPLGKRIRVMLDPTWYTVVGEVGDAHYDALDQPVHDIVYLPLDKIDVTRLSFPSALAVFARSDLPSGQVSAAIRDVVRSLDPSLPTYGEQPLSAVVSAASARARAMLLLLAVASALALVLGAVGLYGVMAYSVSMRRREIGVRIALGAQPGHVGRMVSRQGVTLAAAGVGIGLVVALGVTRFLRSLLYEVSPTDPLALGATCVALLMVALVASWLPARRAALVDPAEALRRG